MSEHEDDELELEPDDTDFDPELLDDEESGANPWAKASSGEAEDV